MSKAGKLVKDMLKAKKESVMGKLGDSPYEDPMEPWSAKYAQPVKEEAEQLDESDPLLFKYIRSLGYNPEQMDFATRSKYARSNAFKNYKISHMNDQLKTEEVEDINEADSYGHIMKKAKEAQKSGDLGQYHKHLANYYHQHAQEARFDSRHSGGAGSYLKNSQKSKMHSSLAADHGVNEEVEELDEAGTGLLMSFIKAKGLNPLSMDGNQKKSYSRSSEFRIFKSRHVKEISGMGERGDDWNEEKKQVKEEADAKDVVSMDIPLLIRVLEFIREDVKTDMDLHRVVENLIDLRTQGVLTMDDYEKAVAIKAIKEEIEQIEELDTKTLDSYITKVATGPSRGMTQKGTLKSIKAIGGVTTALRKKAEKPITELKNQDDNQELDSHITREEKKMKDTDPCWKGYQMVGMKKKGGRSVPNCVPEQVTEGIGGIEDSPMSATNSVKAMESEQRKKNMKSARIIKSIYKKKGKNESIYDWEKDDKPNAKVTLQGGTTMTGKPRDTVEIEPVLKTRPNSQKQ